MCLKAQGGSVQLHKICGSCSKNRANVSVGRITKSLISTFSLKVDINSFDINYMLSG